MINDETTPLSGESPSEISRIQKYFDHPSLDDLAATLREDSDERLLRDAEICWALLETHGKPPRELLGAGTFGVVFRVRDEKLNRDVAIKVLRPSLQNNTQAESRFRFEAQSAAKCNLEGVVPVFEFGELDGRPFIVSQYVPGMSLAKYIDQNRGKIDERRAATIIKAVAQAVHGIHQRDFLHRDIKPANILLEELEKVATQELPFRPLVTDFGLAKFVASDSRAGSKSESSSIIGTLQYMSPEQAAGESKLISVTTDVYALGTVMYEMLTGQPPFKGLTKLALLHNIVHQPPPRLRKEVRGISRELEAIVMKCLCKNPAERYASAQDFALDLDCFLAGKPTLARPASPPRALLLWANRNPAWAAGVATLWLTMAALLVGLAVLYGRERRAVRVANETAQLTVEMTKNYYTRLTEELSKQPGNANEILKLHEDMLSQFTKLAEIRAYDSYSRRQLSIAYHLVARSQERLSLAEASMQSRRTALQLLEKLVLESPENIDYRYSLFHNTLLLSWSCAEAERDHNVAVALTNLRMLIKLQPDNPTYLDALNALLCQEMYFEETRDAERSELLAREVIGSTQRLVDKYPDKPLYGKYLYKACSHLGTLASQRNDFQSAKLYFERALEHLDQMEHSLPNQGESLSEEHTIRTFQVAGYQKLKAHQSLIDCSARFWWLCGELDAWYPNDYVRWANHAETKVWVAESLLATNRVREARSALIDAKVIVSKVQVNDRTKSMLSRFEDSYAKIAAEVGELKIE